MLPKIVKDVQPVLSTDFQKGTEWSSLLLRDLKEASAGIVFLTPENMDAPWIHFEAGALATAVGNRGGDLFTYCYDFDPSRLAGPLSAYHSTIATKEDTRRLVLDLCTALHRKRPDEGTYSAWWLDLEKALDNIQAPSIPELVPGFAGCSSGKHSMNRCRTARTNDGWTDLLPLIQLIKRSRKRVAR